MRIGIDGSGGGGGGTRRMFDDYFVELLSVFEEFEFGAFLVGELYDLVEHFGGNYYDNRNWKEGMNESGNDQKALEIGR